MKKKNKLRKKNEGFFQNESMNNSYTNYKKTIVLKKVFFFFVANDLFLLTGRNEKVKFKRLS